MFCASLDHLCGVFTPQWSALNWSAHGGDRRSTGAVLLPLLLLWLVWASFKFTLKSSFLESKLKPICFFFHKRGWEKFSILKYFQVRALGSFDKSYLASTSTTWAFKSPVTPGWVDPWRRPCIVPMFASNFTQREGLDIFYHSVNWIRFFWHWI